MLKRDQCARLRSNGAQLELAFGQWWIFQAITWRDSGGEVSTNHQVTALECTLSVNSWPSTASLNVASFPWRRIVAAAGAQTNELPELMLAATLAQVGTPRGPYILPREQKSPINPVSSESPAHHYKSFLPPFNFLRCQSCDVVLSRQS
jgi:hypothetical protein